jgi:hypothetical protein
MSVGYARAMNKKILTNKIESKVSLIIACLLEHGWLVLASTNILRYRYSLRPVLLILCPVQ